MSAFTRLWLRLKWLYRKWELMHARQFRARLELTITAERERAQRDVERAELMERRAEMAIVEARADRRIPEDTAPEAR